jgi:hypothetical protein
MISSPATTLFSSLPELNQRSYSFAVSILAHGVATGLVLIGIASTPQVKAPPITEHYVVRRLDLQALEPEMQRTTQSAIKFLRSHSLEHKLSAAGGAAVHPQFSRPSIKAALGPQTLVQLDIPKPVALIKQIPLPTMVIWNRAGTPAKTLVAPAPQRPAVTDVEPAIQPPNDEQRLADLALASTNLALQRLPILPGTTSPVAVHGPPPTPPVPTTTARGAAQPTPAAVISLSDLRMATGDVRLPPVNETASLNSTGGLAAGQASVPAQAGHGGKAGGIGIGQSANSAADSSDAATVAQGSMTDSALGNPLSAAHIALPRNGQFGSVVVGASMKEEYPEIGQIWSGRLGYTVYLHVGLAKSWILQYSVPRAEDAAEAGDVARIEAPWPYNIVRPNLAPGAIGADALMIHGFVDQAGRFEALAIAFPPQFAQTRFVLDSLAQWEFRPAKQNGKNVKVEVLLIIPEVRE